jgi:hypothetical protein
MAISRFHRAAPYQPCPLNLWRTLYWWPVPKRLKRERHDIKRFHAKPHDSRAKLNDLHPISHDFNPKPHDFGSILNDF